MGILPMSTGRYLWSGLHESDRILSFGTGFYAVSVSVHLTSGLQHWSPSHNPGGLLPQSNHPWMLIDFQSCRFACCKSSLLLFLSSVF